MSGIEALHTELKTYVDRTGAKQSEFQRELGEVRRQLDAIDVAGATRHTSMQTKSLDALLQENESVARLLRDKKGTAVIRFTGADASLLEKKTVITETATGGSLSAVGVATTGVLPIRAAGVDSSPTPPKQIV